jgi:hypothetical protein
MSSWDAHMRPMSVVAAAAFLIAQSREGLAQMTTVEQALADKIKCEEWRKNPDGTWTSGSDSRIGSNTFRNTTVAPGAWSVDGADVGAVLNKKCSK